MIADILTVIWKELRESIVNRQGMRGGWVNFAVIIAALGVFIPWQMGKTWLSDPRQLLYWSWMPVLIALSQISDSFAGERERRTLETLLATRLSDQAILFGKILSVVLYAWLLTVTSLLAGAVTINIAFPTGVVQFYPFANFAIGVGVSFLTSLLISCIGVLVSLKSSTVRQAYQRMSVVLIAFWFLPMILLQVIPEGMKEQFSTMISGLDFNTLIPWLIVGLVIINLILLWIVNHAFKRSKLLLEKK